MRAICRKINGEWIAEVTEHYGGNMFEQGQQAETYPIPSSIDKEYLESNNMEGKEIEEFTVNMNNFYLNYPPPTVHSDPSGTNKKIPTWAWNLLRGYMKDSYAIKCWDKLTNYYQTEFGTPSNLPSGEGKGKYYHETEYLDHAEDAFQSGREAGLKEAALQNYDYLYRALYNLWSDVIYNKNVEGKDNALKKATDALMKYEGYHPSLPKPEGKEETSNSSYPSVNTSWSENVKALGVNHSKEFNKILDEKFAPQPLIKDQEEGKEEYVEPTDIDGSPFLIAKYKETWREGFDAGFKSGLKEGKHGEYQDGSAFLSMRDLFITCDKERISLKEQLATLKSLPPQEKPPYTVVKSGLTDNDIVL